MLQRDLRRISARSRRSVCLHVWMPVALRGRCLRFPWQQSVMGVVTLPCHTSKNMLSTQARGKQSFHQALHHILSFIFFPQLITLNLNDIPPIWPPTPPPLISLFSWPLSILLSNITFLPLVILPTLLLSFSFLHLSSMCRRLPYLRASPAVFPYVIVTQPSCPPHPPSSLK